GAGPKPMLPHGTRDARVDRARLHAHEPAVRVDFEDAMGVGREVEDDAVAQSLPREARAAASGRDRNPLRARVLDRARDIGGSAGGDDRDRLTAEDARGGGKESEADRGGSGLGFEER